MEGEEKHPRRRGEVSQGERENAERLLRDALRRDGTCVRALTLLGFSMMERREGEGKGKGQRGEEGREQGRHSGQRRTHCRRSFLQ